MSFGWVPELFVESQTQLPSSAESLCHVEWEHDSAFLLSPVVVQRFQGRLSKSLLSLWKWLSHPSTESPCVVHIVHSLTQRCPLSHTHSWAQRKLSPLSLLNILLTINGPLLS